MTPPRTASPIQKAEIDDLERFIDTLKLDRLLKLVIASGEQQSTFRISESTLCNTSIYFAKALANQHPGINAKEGTLTFPDDNVQTWKVLLYWISKQTLPTLKSEPASPSLQLQLLRCYLLGSKYSIPTFQDAVMLNLLEESDTDDIDHAAAKAAFQGTDSSSPLRRLVAQELVHSIYCTNETKPEFLDELDGTSGVASSMLSVVVDWVRDVGTTVDDLGVFVSRNKDGSEEWRKFMVGERPWRHRLLDERGLQV